MGEDKRKKWFEEFLERNGDYHDVWLWWVKVQESLQKCGFPACEEYPGDEIVRTQILCLE